MLVFATVTITLSVLQFHGVIALPNLEQIIDSTHDKLTNKEIGFTRLAGSGIFHDPNEIGVLISVVFLLGLYWLFDPRFGVPLPFGYALVFMVYALPLVFYSTP